ncbi:hypothetical protein [Herbaspirillum sp. alder98]|uniref:hypothetical protein n=1 Tax=Herbaspirillum sp. alder98 TaxID=2913096 RepID=UPI001CD81E81|nr:hypothetical protein [Herbaspirillum sp. alder98]MCA1325400.1 hypothetical protein [Herbaspirillum sp. alder98]
MLRIFRTLCALTIATVLTTGCITANKQALAPNNVAALKEQGVVATSREKKPDFAAMTAGRATFGLIGAFVMISEGNTLVAENGITDPANEIAISLVNNLSNRYGTKSAVATIPVTGDDISNLSVAPAARYIVDVQTINWGFAYFPTNWTHYRIHYAVKAKLFDAQTKTLLAEGFCRRFPEETPTSPGYDQMLADKAAMIKAAMAQWRDECTAELQKDMFPTEATATTNATPANATVVSKAGT